MASFIRQGILSILLFASLTGCMVGPYFHRPLPPAVASYNEKPLPAKTVATPSVAKGGVSQYFIFDEGLPGDWWRLFHSHNLNKLVRAGIANSPSLIAAQAALRQARENLYAQIGSTMLPAFDLQAGAQRGKSSTAQFASAGVTNIGSGDGNIFNLFNTSVNVSYTLDVFGGARRQIEAVGAQMDFTRFQLLATYLTLTGNIVTTAINIASLEAQIETTKELIQFENNQLQILRQQYRLGAIPLPSVLTQEVLVEQTKAGLPVLEIQLSQAKHALTTLVGVMPDSTLPRLKLSQLKLPRRIPIVCPSELVRQRPDVLQAEALMHVASAQIGVATANLLPQFNITGTYGWTSIFASNLFNPANNIWNIAGNLTQPLFHGGALFALRRAAIAAYQQTAAQYRQTVLQAFQNVADALRAVDMDARALRAERTAEIAAAQGLRLVQQQYRLGGATYLALLIAQQQNQQARIRRIRAQAARYIDTAALFQALGGGWWDAACRLCLRQQYLSQKVPPNCQSCFVVRKAS